VSVPGASKSGDRAVIAIDPHKGPWTAAAVDGALQPLATVRVAASRDGYRALNLKPRTLALRISHFPSPPAATLQPTRTTHLTQRGATTRSATTLGCVEPENQPRARVGVLAILVPDNATRVLHCTAKGDEQFDYQSATLARGVGSRPVVRPPPSNQATC
jgi:hypothetical protein